LLTGIIVTEVARATPSRIRDARALIFGRKRNGLRRVAPHTDSLQSGRSATAASGRSQRY